jgi:hypothetical protein
LAADQIENVAKTLGLSNDQFRLLRDMFVSHQNDIAIKNLCGKFTKHCERCGTHFFVGLGRKNGASRTNKRYCSQACVMAAYRKRKAQK